MTINFFIEDKSGQHSRVDDIVGRVKAFVNPESGIDRLARLERLHQVSARALEIILVERGVAGKMEESG
jgi:hypothetical protein